MKFRLFFVSSLAYNVKPGELVKMYPYLDRFGYEEHPIKYGDGIEASIHLDTLEQFMELLRLTNLKSILVEDEGNRELSIFKVYIKTS